jgi:hypothetical protein
MRHGPLRGGCKKFEPDPSGAMYFEGAKIDLARVSAL